MTKSILLFVVTVLQLLSLSLAKSASPLSSVYIKVGNDTPLKVSNVKTVADIQKQSSLPILPQQLLLNGESVFNSPTDVLSDFGVHEGDNLTVQDLFGSGDMKETMEQMTSMMNSPIFQEFMSDPEKLEQSRQMILNNPMLKGMMAGMPGMEEILNDPEAWKEAMQAAASLYKNMDTSQLMEAMMNNDPSALGGFGGGMNGQVNPSTLAALDELDEED